MEIRQYRESDAAPMLALFRDTILRVGPGAYNDSQIAVWTSPAMTLPEWEARFRVTFTAVAWEGARIVGFANLTSEGEVDLLYVHADKQRAGIGRELLAALEARAIAIGLGRLTSDVSLTAREFFRSVGFQVDREYTKLVRGESFANAWMSKSLGSTSS